ncbi:copper amine oxidase N-terminal domain-containing protein [Paenibacillus chibensis]|uniref:copper amine oxidase N-terminal domain-containing protein n=1 Tax=Paenibacillus chibensis TaxID=59846 RepID=UPI000FD93C7F|nr:copper amine oxidase N-terminal domain-containing protein [Paenibacillus chibensis]MEC0371435.1 copper amine oxidase N-terminal domain-containing protein [Paenibacillus chibensis]
MRTTSRAASFAAVWGLAVLLATTPLFNGTAPAAAASSASVQQNKASISVTLNGNEFTPDSAPFMERGSVYLPLRDIGELLGTIVYWDASSKTVSMTYPERVIKVKPGAVEAEVNGKQIKLTAPVKIVNGRVYVPLRFFSEAIGAGVDWNGSKRTVAITHSAEYVKGGGVNLTIWLNRKTGDIYTAYPFEAVPVASGKLNVDLQEFVNIEAQYLNGGGIMVYVTDNYGEPHIHTAVYTAFIKNKQIVKQTKAKYFQRFERNVYTYNGKPALHDGKTLTLLDENGKVTKEYNLQELGGKDEVYSVLAISDNYLLIRPNTTGLLTLINLKDNSATLLYKELLTPEEQEYSERNDVPYYGDELNFAGESPVGTLNFSYHSPFSGKDRQLKYVMK